MAKVQTPSPMPWKVMQNWRGKITIVDANEKPVAQIPHITPYSHRERNQSRGLRNAFLIVNRVGGQKRKSDPFAELLAAAKQILNRKLGDENQLAAETRLQAAIDALEN